MDLNPQQPQVPQTAATGTPQNTPAPDTSGAFSLTPASSVPGAPVAAPATNSAAPAPNLAAPAPNPVMPGAQTPEIGTAPEQYNMSPTTPVSTPEGLSVEDTGKSKKTKLIFAGVGIIAIVALVYFGKSFFFKGTVPPETNLSPSAPESTTAETPDVSDTASSKAQSSADEALSQASVAESAAVETATALNSAQGKQEEIRVLLVTLDTERARQTLQAMQADGAASRVAADRAAEAVTQIQTIVEDLNAQAAGNESLAAIAEQAKAALAKAEQARDQAAASHTQTQQAINDATQSIENAEKEVRGEDTITDEKDAEAVTPDEDTNEDEDLLGFLDEPTLEELPAEKELADSEQQPAAETLPAAETRPSAETPPAPTPAASTPPIQQTNEAAAPETSVEQLHGSYIQGETGPGALLYPILLVGANGAYWFIRKRKR